MVKSAYSIFRDQDGVQKRPQRPRLVLLPPLCQLVAEVLVGLATDTTGYLSRWGDVRKVDELTVIIRASDSSWHPAPPPRPPAPIIPVALLHVMTVT